MTDKAREPTGDLSALQATLRRSRELGLSDDQLNKVRTLYAEARRDLNKANAASAAAELEVELARMDEGQAPGLESKLDELANIRRRMSDIRIRATSLALEVLHDDQRRGLLTQAGGTHETDALTDVVQKAVEARVKDQKVVEIEMAAAVLERLVGWAKVFAWCVAIPVTVLIAIFAVAGISKIADFISKVNDSEKKIKKYVDTSEEELAKAVKQANDTAARYQSQLAEIEAKQATLEQSVKDLKERLVGAPGANVPPALLSTLRTTFEPFQKYLMKLGYKPDREHMKFAYAEKDKGSEAYYYDGTIYVSEKYASNPDLAFREYMHHVLWEGTGKPMTAGGETASAMESGLADYFVASFTKSPRPYAREFKVDLENQPKFVSGSKIERFSTGTIWAGAFWALRKALTPEVADKVLFDAWAARSVGVSRETLPAMVQSILATSARLLPGRQDEVADILREHGLPVE